MQSTQGKVARWARWVKKKTKKNQRPSFENTPKKVFPEAKFVLQPFCVLPPRYLKLSAELSKVGYMKPKFYITNLNVKKKNIIKVSLKGR